MKKIKHISHIVFLLFAPIVVSSCSAANNADNDVTFYLRGNDVYNGTYQVGDPIDTEYFFYVEDATKAKITVSYTGEDGSNYTDEVTGHTYYPRCAGNYVFTCIVGKRSLRKSVRVEDAAPTLNIDDMPDIEVAGKFLYFDDIIAKVAPSYTPAKSSIKVSHVEFKPLAKSIDDEPTYRIISSSEDGFSAKEPGNYRIYCSVANGVKYVTGTINVVVVRKNNDGNEYVAVGENGKYLSNHALVRDSSALFTLPKARYSESSYVAMEKQISLGDQVAVRFKGKNIPMIGLLMQQSAAGDFSPNGASGHYLTFEYNGLSNWNLKSPSLFTGINWKGSVYNEAARRFERFGMSDLADDKFYYLSCNLTENVAYTPETTSDSSLWGRYLHCITWSIYEIENYGTDKENIGRPLMDIFHSGWLDEYSQSTGSVVFYSSFYRDITFEVMTLPRDVGNGMVVYDGQKRADGSIVLAPGLKTSSGNTANDVASSYLAYPGNYGAGTSVAFEFEGANIPDVCLFADSLSGPTGEGEGLLIGQGTEDPSLRGRTTFYAPYRLDCLNNNGHGDSKHGNCTQTGYATLGNNDRIYTAYSGYKVALVDGEYVPSGEASPFGRDILDPKKTYVYKVSIDHIVKNENGKYDVSISLSLYEKNEDDLTLVCFLPTTVKDYDGPISGNIIAYPEIQYPLLFPSVNAYATEEEFNAAFDKWEASKWARHTTIFKPYAINGSPLDGSTYEGSVSNGTVSLNGLLKDETVESEPNEDRYHLPYVGLKDAMDVGDALKVTYKGKNIPNICLLADSDHGQAICGGQGFYLATSFIVDSTIATRDHLNSMNAERLTPFGPYRWSDDYGHNGWDTKYRYFDQTLYRSGYGVLEQDDNANYEYCVKIVSLQNGVLTLNTSIKNLDSGAFISDRKDVKYDLKSHLNPGDSLQLGKNVIFYGHGRGITFQYEINHE